MGARYQDHASLELPGRGGLRGCGRRCENGRAGVVRVLSVASVTGVAGVGLSGSVYVVLGALVQLGEGAGVLACLCQRLVGFGAEVGGVGVLQRDPAVAGDVARAGNTFEHAFVFLNGITPL